MKYTDFANSSAGRLVPTLFDEKAFLPNPLPPNLDFARLAPPLGSASAALGELRGACRRLSNPYMLIRPLQALEAQTSSALEGTYTTFDDLVMAEAGLNGQIKSETQEVSNYIRALDWAVNEIGTLPISARLIKGAHAKLMARVGAGRGQDKRPGEFKRDQNMIGANPALNGKERLRSARFVPPPRHETDQAISELERFIHRDDKTAGTALIDLALVHYQFETIHPFDDGNGRVGRMLISLLAMTEKLTDLPVLYMSPELESRKDDYIDLMYRVSAHGAWEDWIEFFLAIAELSAQRTIKTIDSILILHQTYRDKGRNASRSSNLTAIIDMLFESPIVQARTVVDKLNVTDAAARNLLRQLTQIGILVERTEYYPAVWFASELIATTQSF